MQWAEVEPVLRVTYRLIDQDGSTGGQAVAEALGLPDDDEKTMRAIRQLDEAGYLRAQIVASGHAAFIDPTEKGLQAFSGWPEPGNERVFVAAFLAEVDARANDESTPEPERNRLMELAHAAGEVGKEVLTDVMAKVLSP